jgi:hypothetical protein
VSGCFGGTGHLKYLLYVDFKSCFAHFLLKTKHPEIKNSSYLGSSYHPIHSVLI